MQSLCTHYTHNGVLYQSERSNFELFQTVVVENWKKFEQFSHLTCFLCVYCVVDIKYV